MKIRLHRFKSLKEWLERETRDGSLFYWLEVTLRALLVLIGGNELLSLFSASLSVIDDFVLNDAIGVELF